MTDTTDSVSQITEAIEILQDAIKKEAISKKIVRADIVSAANILLGILGLASVAPDGPDGQRT
jgi:hypothetical protein